MRLELTGVIPTDYMSQVLTIDTKTGAVLNADGAAISMVKDQELKDFCEHHKQSSYPARMISPAVVEAVTFVELRGKTDYSIQTGIAKCADVIKKSDVGAAITDLGTGFGLFAFNQAGVKQGKKTIMGCEFFVHDKDRHAKYEYDHLVILAKNKAGYHDLARLITLAASRPTAKQMESSRTKKLVKPHIFLSDLENYDMSNMIVLSAYDQGSINKSLRAGNKELAKETVTTLLNLFQPGDVYLEVQFQRDSDLPSDDFSISDALNELSEEFGIKRVLTHDYHMMEPEDKPALDIMQAIRQQKKLDENPDLIEGSDLYVHKARDVESKGYPAEFLDATIEIFNKCEFYDLYTKENFMPPFVVPSEFEDDKAYFRYLSKKGLTHRMGHEKYEDVNAGYRDRLEYEMDMIENMGFASYFLITADFLSYAKRNYQAYDEATAARWTAFIEENGYDPKPIAIGPGRGSAAGSLVAYAMAITDEDPIPMGLIFER